MPTTRILTSYHSTAGLCRIPQVYTDREILFEEEGLLEKLVSDAEALQKQINRIGILSTAEANALLDDAMIVDKIDDLTKALRGTHAALLSECEARDSNEHDAADDAARRARQDAVRAAYGVERVA